MRAAVGEIDRARSRAAEWVEGGEIGAVEAHGVRQAVEPPAGIAGIARRRPRREAGAHLATEMGELAGGPHPRIDPGLDVLIEHAVGVGVTIERPLDDAVGAGPEL